MKRALMLIVASATISAVASAQDTRSDIVACRDTVNAPGLYRRCALRFEGGKVRRGEEGVVVAKPGFFAPLRLTQVVAGDSATAYARTFERRSRQAGAFGFAGGVLMAGALIVLDRRECTENLVLGCDHHDNLDFVAAGLVIPGIGFTIAGGILQTKASRAGSRAIWWNNERYAR